MLGKFGEVEEEHNGNLKVTRNGQVIVLHPPRTKDVAEMDEIMTLRHFLQHSELAAPDTHEKKPHWLLVIDHHEARIFRAELDGGVPERILPHVPDDYFHDAHDSKSSSRGQEQPDPKDFFEPVAKVLQIAGPILIFGNGTGTSSEMHQFIEWIKLHHPQVAARIIGSQAVDESHLSEGQLLAKAREFYAALPASMAQKA
jgi:hypothetical protein